MRLYCHDPIHTARRGSDAFRPYGRVVAGYRFDGLLQVLREHTPRPSDGTVYVASDPRLERLPVFGEVQAGFFGGLPAQFGYCNGVNTRLACCEYHQCSELLVAAGRPRAGRRAARRHFGRRLRHRPV